MATNITMATSRAEDGDVEVERVGSLVVESLLMMGIDDQEGSKTALKVHVHVQVTDAKIWLLQKMYL